MLQKDIIRFTDNSALSGSNTAYLGIVVDAQKVLESWRSSLFSFEWLLPDGTIRAMEQLPDAEQVKRSGIERKISGGELIEKPVLGIGIMDNVEIGIGRAEFLTLAANGEKTIHVHIPKSNESDFKVFLAKLG